VTRIQEALATNTVGEGVTSEHDLHPCFDWNLIPHTSSRSLGHLFDGPNRIHLEIDGYNLGFRLLEWSDEIDYRSEQSVTDLEYLRNKVIKFVSTLCHQFPNCTARIVFDSPRHSFHTVDDRVVVTYSGGSGSNRADRNIVFGVRIASKLNRYDHIIIVSDDRHLTWESTEFGARGLSNVEFCNLLKRKVA